jgi:hypothetical protein
MSQESWNPWWKDTVDLTAPEPKAKPAPASLAQTPPAQDSLTPMQPEAPLLQAPTAMNAPVQDLAPPMQALPPIAVNPAPINAAQTAAPQPPTLGSRTNTFFKDMFNNPDDKATHDPGLPRTAAITSRDAAYKQQNAHAPNQALYAPAVPMKAAGKTTSFGEEVENWFDNMFAMPGDNMSNRPDLPRTTSNAGRVRSFH